MNPNDNQNQPIPVNNQQQDGVNSIAPKDEIPMSIEKVETPAEETTPNVPDTQIITPISTEVNNTQQPVTSIFNQETNPSEIKKDNSQLFNYQTNAINPNANVNINDFRIDETVKNTPISEVSNLESTTLNSPEKNNIENTQKGEEVVVNFNQAPSSNIEIKPEPTVSSSDTIAPATPATSSNNTILIAILGIVIAIGLVAGAYFVFFRKPTSTQNNYVAGDYKTEKIVVSNNTEEKVLTIDEYKATIKSYIDRYNNNIRNSKVKLATPNLSVDDRLKVFIDYSSEILDIYTEIQNLRVPETFKEPHDKLTYSLYAVNILFDTLVIDYKNKTLTPDSEKQILESITKAEDVAAKAFNEIANSQ